MESESQAELSWIAAHFDQLQREYGGQWIAVVGDEMVAHHRDLKEVEATCERLEVVAFTKYVQPKVISNLLELNTDEMNIDIELADGSHFLVPFRPLRQSEWDKIGREVASPAPPKVAEGPRGVVYNYSDPGYIEAFNLAEMERVKRRLAMSLKLTIEGETAEQKAHWLENNLDRDVFQGLLMGFIQGSRDRSAQVEARASSFQRGRANGASDTGTAG